jgi:glutathione S-transferase
MKLGAKLIELRVVDGHQGRMSHIGTTIEGTEMMRTPHHFGRPDRLGDMPTKPGTPHEASTQPYELYTISGAPRPWRVALALVAKRLPFTPRILEGSQNQQKSPGFLALNPRGRTPVLTRGDFVLTESLAILAYLEQAHPEPSLFSPDPARIWEHVMTLDHDLREAAGAVTGPVFKGADTSTDAIRDGARRLLAELRRLDDRLASQPFLCGATITAADCVAFPDVRLTLRASERAPDVMSRLGIHPIADTAPRVRRWIDRVEALPGYEQTFPAHWR